MEIKPLSKEEVKRGKTIPDIIIKTVNELLIKNYHNGKAIIMQSEIVDMVSGDSGDPDCISRTDIYDNNYLDFEDIYRAIGWKVTYDKPGYSESYDPRFIFE
jgi:hypothetical protein